MRKTERSIHRNAFDWLQLPRYSFLDTKEEQKKQEQEQIIKLLKTPLLFPQKPSERVKYAMALANLILIGSREPPSEQNKIRIDANGMPRGYARYLWTAFMVFGENLPDKSFDHEALSIRGASHSYNECFFDEEKELGGFWFTFSNTSLYETVFKHHLTDDMLSLTENPELFEGLSNQGYKTVAEQIQVKEKKIPEEQQKEDMRKQVINKLITTPSLFPKTPSGWVKYTMALANLMLVNIEPPTEEVPIVMRKFHNKQELAKYLWTAFMVFGKNLPYGSFDHHALQIIGIIGGFNPDNELGGFWSDFSKESLYETVFKHHLTPSMLVLTEDPEFFEGISNQLYKTITEQIRAKEEGPYKSLASMQEEVRTHETMNVQQNTGTRQAHNAQEDFCEEPLRSKASSLRPSCSSGPSNTKRNQSALELAQQTEAHHPNDFNRIFSSYLQAAHSGHNEALAPLERLAQEANKDQQLALSQLYGSFFHSREKADYWRQKAMEVTQSPFDIPFS